MRAYGKSAVGVAAVLLVGIAAIAAAARGGGDSSAKADPALSWVHPTPLPPTWSVRALPGSPAELPLPPGWAAVHGDAGTRTAELKGPAETIDGYLNATPRQGSETPANWSKFRIAHNREEGEREVKSVAAATHLPFRGGTGSCVVDSYRTTSGNRFREVACIVAGRSATTVIVAAAPPPLWRAEVSTLERAITSFRT